MYELVCKVGRTHSYQVQLWKEGHDRAARLEMENHRLKMEIEDLKIKELVRKAIYEKR